MKKKSVNMCRAPGEKRMGCFGLRLLASILAIVFLLSLFACASSEKETEQLADYGQDGATFARKLAKECPRRIPFSNQEKKAAQLIIEQLETEGYEPEQQFFTVKDAAGVEHTSSNIIVRLKGVGFRRSKTAQKRPNVPDTIRDRLLVIGAHYDTPWIEDVFDADGQPIPIKADGIHDNASGVAAVLTAARVMREMTPGYDVTFVFFGAGTANYAGASYFLKTMSKEDRERLECMMNIGPVYAGDKVYAHAGQNSVVGGEFKDYLKRRKLYQVTDVFFENLLYTRNGYAVYTNQASFQVQLDNGQTAIFREWTTKRSDHTPFDEAGIPVVFIESGDYNIESLDEVGLESVNQMFQDTNGRLSGTNWDNTKVLDALFEELEKLSQHQEIPQISTIKETQADGRVDPSTTMPAKKVIDRLTQRVNNTAFVLAHVARKGPLDYEFAP
ncbi:MAG: M28 family peptidase [Clostridiaceae bacterium]|jgi:alkaline phosphatase isozyme conversion protein|nr:M28 family peptidase [Clostridiaceae bacterium]